jgi:hypothetical protein
MWGRDRAGGKPEEAGAKPGRLREAIREARIAAAERTGVVVEMRDAEAARLELLNETLDPVFAEVPPEIELFDRALSRGDTPRLWIDAIAHVAMGPDKRVYRFVQDTRYGRKIIAESAEVPVIADAVTRYVAARLVERDRALATDLIVAPPPQPVTRISRFWHGLWTAIWAVAFGVAAFLAAAWLIAKP